MFLSKRLSLQALVPGGLSDLTPSGRVRLTDENTIPADVLAQPISWRTSGQTPALNCVAHAVFARVGGYRSSWARRQLSRGRR